MLIRSFKGDKGTNTNNNNNKKCWEETRALFERGVETNCARQTPDWTDSKALASWPRGCGVWPMHEGHKCFVCLHFLSLLCSMFIATSLSSFGSKYPNDKADLRSQEKKKNNYQVMSIINTSVWKELSILDFFVC